MNLKYLAIAFVLSNSFGYGFAASFDCKSTNLSDLERAVCVNSDLSKLDEDLSKLYKEARANSSNPDSIRKDQLAWLKQSRNTCSTIECLSQAYTLRINELSKYSDSVSDAKSERNQEHTLTPKSASANISNDKVLNTATFNGETRDGIGENFIQCAGYYSGVYEYVFSNGDDESTSEDAKVPKKLAEINKLAANSLVDHDYVTDTIPKFTELFRARLEQYGMAGDDEGHDAYIQRYNQKCMELANQHPDTFNKAVAQQKTPPPAPVVNQEAVAAVPMIDDKNVSNEQWCKTLADRAALIIGMTNKGASIEIINTHISSLRLQPEDEQHYKDQVYISLMTHAGKNPSGAYVSEYNACRAENP